MNSFLKAVIGIIASKIAYPSIVIAWLHQLRGVKIKNIRNVFISMNVAIDNVAPELIQIGEDVKLTRNVTILSHFHPTQHISKYYGAMKYGKVVIEDGVFIGVGAIILPGVTIGKSSIVGAGAVVTKDVPPYTVVAGNPAIILKYLSTEDNYEY